MKTQELMRLAKETGFTHAAPMDPGTLRFLPEVRDMCAADRCRSYNRNWMCPPACGTLEDFSARAAQFGKGVLFQTVGVLEDCFDAEGMQETMRLHAEHQKVLAQNLRAAGLTFLLLGAGACTLCPKCTYPESPCRHPELAVTSMEASGLLVSDVCTKNGVPYNYGPDRLAFTGCVLFD